jgi:hypothetical protein
MSGVSPVSCIRRYIIKIIVTLGAKKETMKFDTFWDNTCFYFENNSLKHFLQFMVPA